MWWSQYEEEKEGRTCRNSNIQVGISARMKVYREKSRWVMTGSRYDRQTVMRHYGLKRIRGEDEKILLISSSLEKGTNLWRVWAFVRSKT